MKLPDLGVVVKDFAAALIDRFDCGNLVFPSWNA